MNDRYPQALEEVMELLRGLPGVGRRSAERMALELFSWDETKLNALADILAGLKKRVGKCSVCGNLADIPEREGGGDILCPVCASPSRDGTLLCVVEDAAQIRSIEASGVYRGVYHVLGGRLAPLEGKGVEAITADALEARIAHGAFRELIFALSPDVEGQATAVYLAQRLQRFNLKTSCLARGLPAGSELSYADPATVAAALTGRIAFDRNGKEE